MKACACCKVNKEPSEFAKAAHRSDGLRPYCKPCSNEKNRKYRKENPEAAAASSAKWYRANKDKKSAQVKKWAQKNKDRSKAKAKEWREANPNKYAEYWRRSYVKNRKHNRHYQIHNAIGGRIRDRLRGAKWSRTEELIGYPVEDLMACLELQFLKGMNWDNYGQWHIDHIIPLSAFECSGSDPEEIKKAWAIPNLRPIWASDNLRKSWKRLYLL